MKLPEKIHTANARMLDISSSDVDIGRKKKVAQIFQYRNASILSSHVDLFRASVPDIDSY
jgi:hypothetical protein